MLDIDPDTIAAQDILAQTKEYSTDSRYFLFVRQLFMVRPSGEPKKFRMHNSYIQLKQAQIMAEQFVKRGYETRILDLLQAPCIYEKAT